MEVSRTTVIELEMTHNIATLPPTNIAPKVSSRVRFISTMCPPVGMRLYAPTDLSGLLNKNWFFKYADFFATRVTAIEMEVSVVN